MIIDLVSIDWIPFHKIVYIEWIYPWDNKDEDDCYNFVTLDTIGLDGVE